jgi:UDP-N-acetylmuramyl pentapeptide phosphotransferase/UDP-N-acetylglucosamine-1-phosphate transferase
MTLRESTVVVALCACAIALVLTKATQYIAVRRNLMDVPNARSSHVVPTPRLGGIAIVIATLVGCAMAATGWSGQLVALAFGGILLAATGFLDDIRPLPAWAKYPPQILAAIVMAMVIEPRLFIDFPFIDAYLRGVPAIILSVIWMTAVTNAYNFMDGLDGLAGGSALVAAISLALMFDGGNAFILLPLAGALAGFLVWNVHPASIFMGDMGSQFIGFVLAATMLMKSEGYGGYVHTIPAIIVFVPILFDTGLTIYRRARDGENVFAAHRSHLYQRLNIAGVGQRTVAALYWGATLFCAIIASWYRSGPEAVQALLIMLGATLLGAFAIMVGRFERREAPVESGAVAKASRRRSRKYEARERRERTA